MKTKVQKRPSASNRGTKRVATNKVSSVLQAQPNADEVVGFQVDGPRNSATGCGPSPYIQLSKEGSRVSIKHLRDPKDVVIKARKVTLVIEYPVFVKKRVELVAANKNGFTRTEVAQKIAQAYQNLYAEEERSTALPIESMAERSGGPCMIINRAPTNGMWGIWGHDLGDLALHTIYYTASDKTLRLGVDS